MCELVCGRLSMLPQLDVSWCGLVVMDRDRLEEAAGVQGAAKLSSCSS